MEQAATLTLPNAAYGSLARRKHRRIRSLYAAEHAMQATIWHMAGIIVGTSLYGVLTRYGVTAGSGELSAAQLWLFLFLVPYALMQIGLLCFMGAVWIVTPHFFRRLRAAKFRRTVQ